jgi:hypothetical protein
MKILILRLAVWVGFATICLGLLLLMNKGIKTNYAEYSTGEKTVISAIEAESMSYAIDLLFETGVRIDFARPYYGNYLQLTLAPDCTYRVEFWFNNKSSGSFVVDSGRWASITDAMGGKPILHLIPAYIVETGYNSLSISVLRGNGSYRVSNVSVLTLNELSSEQRTQFNVIDFEIKQLEIEIGNKNFEKLQQYRDEILSVGLNNSTKAVSVNADIKSSGKKYNSAVNLKGHSSNFWGADKWSLSVNLKGDDALWGLQKFDVNEPASRSYLYELIISEWWRKLGGIALRYDMADVYINGEYKGVFLIEEHPEKRAVENSQKREAPVVKWDNGYRIDTWQKYSPKVFYPKTGALSFDSVTPKSDAFYYGYITIKLKRTLESESLTNWAQYAISLMNMYQSGNASIEQVFDLDLYAKFYALIDIWDGTHNQEIEDKRDYFNPVTALFEPIPSDMNIGWSRNDLAIYGFDDNSGGKNPATLMFADKDFRLRYAAAAKEIIQGAGTFFAEIEPELERCKMILQRDEYNFTTTYDSEWIHDSMELEQTYYDTKSRISPTLLFYNGTLTITSTDPAPILITGLYDVNGNSIDVNSLPQKILPNSVLELSAEELNNIRPHKITYEYYYLNGTYTVFTEQGYDTDKILAFYAVGHFYGEHFGGVNDHPAPSFVSYAPKIANDNDISFGIIMGDVAIQPSDEEYQRDIAVLASTGKDFYAIPGNHDEADGGALFEKYFGKKYNSFSRDKNLFLLLDSNMSENGISAEGAQAQMIRGALQENPDVNNIFVFTHELIWYDQNDPKFNWYKRSPNDNIGINYSLQMPSTFNDELLPLFEGIDADIYFIAGDANMYEQDSGIFYGYYDGITYIATGLGSEVRDNILKFDIYRNGDVDIDLIALSGDDPNALGEIEDYTFYAKPGEGQ